MKCSGSGTCENCGAAIIEEDRDCKAEVPLAILLDMQQGKRPRIPCLVTYFQSVVLSAVNDFPQDDPSLIGSRLARLFAAIGIPHCGGCEERKKWLNEAHEWFRGP